MQRIGPSNGTVTLLDLIHSAILIQLPLIVYSNPSSLSPSLPVNPQTPKEVSFIPIEKEDGDLRKGVPLQDAPVGQRSVCEMARDGIRVHGSLIVSPGKMTFSQGGGNCT